MQDDPEKLIGPYLRALKTGERELLAAVADSARQLGKRAFPFLAAALHSESETVRARAADLRGSLGIDIVAGTIREEETDGTRTATGPDTTDGRVLDRIETYEAPPFPVYGSTDRETCDYRILHGVAVPDTLVAALLYDVWKLALERRRLLDEFPVPEAATVEFIKTGIEVYLNMREEQIPGLRPWTHWSFVRQLTEAERELLAEEIRDELRANGVWIWPSS